ncbi:unnamed protein product [Mytilus edulis]|uniref:Reverse transcriptase/retrotransposon-derived protein RNase H-like domain-containing protein n=1 Tax=Mytilus edulis TaxID=6550 RepID=A0A8S3RE08_MYTED|nr:unnamed protein product [Mytilus edulis]
MDRERNKSGFFIRNKSKKSKKAFFFKKLNNDRKNTSFQNADLQDHNQYTHYLTDIGCEVSIDEEIIDANKSNTWMEGRRVVELDVLAREMYCCRCNLPLHLSNTVGERLFGLASVLLIKCDNSACLATTDVHTGKRTPNGSYCINSKVAIEECQEAFEALKGKLTKAPILDHLDLSRSLILDTDASNNGAVLPQEIDGKDRVIAFGSRIYQKTERKYCVYKERTFISGSLSKNFIIFCMPKHSSFKMTTAHCNGS